jgi:hypothetical protein
MRVVLASSEDVGRLVPDMTALETDKQAIVLPGSQHKIEPGLDGEVFYRRWSVHRLLRVSPKRYTGELRICFAWGYSETAGTFINHGRKSCEVVLAISRLSLIDEICGRLPREVILPLRH